MSVNGLQRFAEKVTVVIPTLNEAGNVEPLLDQIFSQRNPSLEIEVLFVDDGSTDGTCDRISNFAKGRQVRLLCREHARDGLAGAVIEGAAAAPTRWVVVMDADLSHPPERIGDLMAPLLDGSKDMVIGSRYISGGRTPGWPWWRRSMSRMACLLASPLTAIKDPLSGFFATRRSSILDCEGDAAGFKIALELIVKGKIRVGEIPVVFHDRVRGQSKMRLSVLLTYLTRLGSLLLWQSYDDFRTLGRSLTAIFRLSPPPPTISQPEH
jgi:dolichol-phosphate mannosyltransferase